MLCDDVIHGSNPQMWKRPFGVKSPKDALRDWLTIAANRVREAQRFAISPEALHVAVHVSQSKPSSLVAGLGIARLPFAKMFIEYDWNKRLEILQTEFNYADQRENPRDRLKVGLLVDASDETLRRGTIHMVTKYDDRSPTMSPLLLDFDFASNDENLVRQQHLADGSFFTIHDVQRLSRSAHPQDYSPRFISKPDEQEAMAEINNLFNLRYDPAAKPHLQYMSDRMGGAAEVKRYVEHWHTNMAGEARFFMSVIMLLNSRNLAEIHDISVREANRARSTRDSPAIVSHRRVKIKLTKVSRNRMAAQGITAGEMPWHMVRGHWKVRKTGVFFWRPYFAGNRERGTITHEYDINP